MDRNEIVQKLKDEAEKGRLVDFQQDTIDWDEIVGTVIFLSSGQLHEANRQARIYRAAYILMRDYQTHVLTCTMCVKMAAGGEMCPTYRATREACYTANVLNWTD